MAVANGVVWEVRCATGSDNNGGGYKAGASGTDFSQQTSPQFALTGIASAGAGNVFLTAAAASSMIGNIARVVSGTNFNVGDYEITAVSAGVSVTCSTNAAGASLSTGVGASGVINIGGAKATLKAAVASAAIQNTIYMVGTDTVTSAVAFTLSDATPMKIIGYTTTRTDEGKATLTTATDSIDLFTIKNIQGYQFENFIFSSTASTRGKGLSATADGVASCVVFRKCRFTGFNIAIFGPFSGQYYFDGLMLFDCEVDNCISHGIRNEGSVKLFGCSIHDNGGNGIEIDSPQGNYKTITIVNSAVWKNVGKGVNSVVLNHFVANSIFSDNGGNGYECSSSNIAGIFANNIFYANTGNGLHIPNGLAIAQFGNAYGANAAPRSGVPVGPGDITLTADPFTSRSTGNFLKNSTAGGGVLLKQTGFQSSLLG